MKLANTELTFLAAWAREEAEPACYQLPAHRLQLAHGVPAELMTVLIKAWALLNRKKDREILCSQRLRNCTGRGRQMKHFRKD